MRCTRPGRGDLAAPNAGGLPRTGSAAGSDIGIRPVDSSKSAASCADACERRCDAANSWHPSRGRSAALDVQRTAGGDCGAALAERVRRTASPGATSARPSRSRPPRPAGVAAAYRPARASPTSAASQLQVDASPTARSSPTPPSSPRPPRCHAVFDAIIARPIVSAGIIAQQRVGQPRRSGQTGGRGHGRSAAGRTRRATASMTAMAMPRAHGRTTANRRNRQAAAPCQRRTPPDGQAGDRRATRRRERAAATTCHRAVRPSETCQRIAGQRHGEQGRRGDGHTATAARVPPRRPRPQAQTRRGQPTAAPISVSHSPADDPQQREPSARQRAASRGRRAPHRHPPPAPPASRRDTRPPAPASSSGAACSALADHTARTTPREQQHGAPNSAGACAPRRHRPRLLAQVQQRRVGADRAAATRSCGAAAASCVAHSSVCAPHGSARPARRRAASSTTLSEEDERTPRAITHGPDGRAVRASSKPRSG